MATKPKDTGTGALALDQQPTTTTALATVDPDTAALAGMLDTMGIEDDGLSEVGAEDIKLPLKLWNFKGTDPAGDPIPPNVFFDTVTEQTSRTLDVVLINLHKTNEWREYDEGSGKSVIRCRSFDQLKGVMDDGTNRPCKGCPDAQWRSAPAKDGKSKRTKRCGQVDEMFAAELATSQPCVLRFKRTSLPVIEAYLNKHHLGRRVERGKRSDWPLFVYHCRISLKMSDDKKYAIPVLERGEVLPREVIEQSAATVPYVKTVLLAMLSKVTDLDRSDDVAGAGDTSFDTSKYTEDSGKDFVDSGAASGGSAA
jgi:hypothetical protein